MSMEFNFADFEKGLAELANKAVPKQLDRGLFDASAMLLKLSIEEEPHAPRYFGPKGGGGDLWASARIKGAGSNLYKREAKPIAFNSEKEGEASVATAGFNIEYAARWHEINSENISMTDKLGRVYSGHWPIRWTLAGAGPKFLESKMYIYSKELLEIMGSRLKELLGKGKK